ncbi:MAG: diaminopimelate decarboxylase [Verrucomicrobiota bacterium]
MSSSHDPALLEKLAEAHGTPYWIYDAAVVQDRIGKVKAITDSPNVQARFAMKACSARHVLREMLAEGIWIDSVSGNEVLRALNAGYPKGHQPPQICFTADVFRDNSLSIVLENDILPNVGSPGMIDQLAEAGYRGPISVRVNPGFGHGHVNSCDTGGPSSKHGVWFEDVGEVAKAARAAGLSITMIHAHIGSGPQFEELERNLTQLAEEFGRLLPHFPDIESVSLGGGIPHDYRDPEAAFPLNNLKQLFASAQKNLSEIAGRDVLLEIEPGRFYVAPSATLVSRVTDIKTTNSNAKGEGARFAMVDAGFVDLIRPAMYGSWHRIEVVGKTDGPKEPIVVAGPMCESGDVFTRDEAELLQPRDLPRPEVGDLLTIHDGGAYGYVMASNYNSIGRIPQLWLGEDGKVEVMSRRETLEDILRLEES